jgi:hypothetical protein
VRYHPHSRLTTSPDSRVAAGPLSVGLFPFGSFGVVVVPTSGGFGGFRRLRAQRGP